MKQKVNRPRIHYSWAAIEFICCSDGSNHRFHCLRRYRIRFRKYRPISVGYFCLFDHGTGFYADLWETSDMYGRKIFFVIGLSLFLGGSILCGLADSIVELSIFRAIQGLGAGALMPIVYTIIYSVIPDHLRSKIGGLFGSAFGIASICVLFLDLLLQRCWAGDGYFISISFRV